MNKKNAAYWQKRAELLEQTQHNKTIEYFGTLEREYQKAIAATEKEINNWYARFANENKVSFQEAQKLLSKKELDEFRWTVEDYIKYGKENAQNQAWVKQLENASARAHISRLDALKVQMQNQVEMLMGNERDGVTDLIEDIYTSSYYQSIFDIQKGSGIAFNFSKLDASAVEKVISKPWTTDGTNFSERIWGNYRPALVNDLHTALTQATIKGDNPKTLVNKISKRYKVKQSQAENLCLTEGAFFRSSGQYSGYKESGVNEYEICATLDGKTSEICREMDSKHFSIAKWQVGVTAPPFHNRCRTATCPYFNDEFTVDETRIARDENGNSYTVEDMSYSEWKEKFVDNIDKKSFTNKTKSDIIFNNATVEAFTEAVKAAKAAQEPENAWRVTAMTTEEFKEAHPGALCHITSGGSVAAVTTDGDIVSVCGMPGDSIKGKELMSRTITAGGKKLDSYEGNHGFYIKCGFEPVSWCKWDEAYAPDGWVKGRDKPEDIIFYRYTGNKLTLNITEAKEHLQSFKKSVAVSRDYDTAQAFRDYIIE